MKGGKDTEPGGYYEALSDEVGGGEITKICVGGEKEEAPRFLLESGVRACLYLYP